MYKLGSAIKNQLHCCSVSVLNTLAAVYKVKISQIQFIIQCLNIATCLLAFEAINFPAANTIQILFRNSK